MSPDLRSLAGARHLAEATAFRSWRLVTRHRVDSGPYSGFVAAATYTPWKADEDFKSVATQVAAHTLVDASRLYELWTLVGQLAPLDGDILEVGVWRGGSGCLMAERSRRDGASSHVYLADTFTGVAKASERDPIYRGGEHADTSPDVVRGLASSMGLDNVELLVGMFPDDTAAEVADRTFKLVHVDVDTYGSAKQVTEWAWPRVALGGVIVYDDYGTPTTQGVREFVDEFRGTPGAITIHNLNQHAITVKSS